MQSIIIISKNKNFTELLKNYLNEIFQEILYFDEVSFDCLNLLKSDNKIILIDADEDKSAIKKIIERNNTTKIIAISADATTSNVINIMRQGAWDFLQKPILKETLLKSIDKILTKDLTCESSKIFSVFSNKGGIGKTTIAVNLAYELSKTTSQKVLLLDMNLQAGDIATFLNIDTFIDLEKLGSEKDKINSDYLESVLANYDNSNLYILSQEHNIQKAIKTNPENITSLISILRKYFTYIIIDLPPNFDEITFSILDISDTILLNTIINIPAIRNCQKCLELFSKLDYPRKKIKIILNRFMENDEISTTDVETTLNKKIYWKIPNNYFTVMAAINKGLPITKINNNSNVAQAYRDLAINLAQLAFEEDFSANSNSYLKFKNLFN